MKEAVSVDKIASLAYLELKADQKAKFQSQIEAVLGYIDQLQKVPMTPEEAKQMGAFHVSSAFLEILGLDAADNLRDETQTSEVDSLNLSNEEAVKSAPKTGGIPGELLYEVPSIIER